MAKGTLCFSSFSVISYQASIDSLPVMSLLGFTDASDGRILFENI